MTGREGEEEEWGERGEEPSRKVCKGHIDKAKGGRFKAERQGWVGQGSGHRRRSGVRIETTVLE